MQRILIVDDEPSVLEALSEYFADDYEITTASSAKEAIEHLEGVDLAIVDMFMETNESGMEVLKAAKKAYPFLQCIVLTAYGAVPNAVEAMKLGAYDYVEKQTDNVYEVLAHRVKQALKYRDSMRYADNEINQGIRTAANTLSGVLTQIQNCVALLNSVANARTRLLRNLGLEDESKE